MLQCDARTSLPAPTPPPPEAVTPAVLARARTLNTRIQGRGVGDGRRRPPDPRHSRPRRAAPSLYSGAPLPRSSSAPTRLGSALLRSDIHRDCSTGQRVGTAVCVLGGGVAAPLDDEIAHLRAAEAQRGATRSAARAGRVEGDPRTSASTERIGRCGALRAVCYSQFTRQLLKMSLENTAQEHNLWVGEIGAREEGHTALGSMGLKSTQKSPPGPLNHSSGSSRCIGSRESIPRRQRHKQPRSSNPYHTLDCILVWNEMAYTVPNPASTSPPPPHPSPRRPNLPFPNPPDSPSHRPRRKEEGQASAATGQANRSSSRKSLPPLDKPHRA